MKRKFVEERNWSIDEMTPEERDVAARLCEDLFDELAVDNADVMDVIQTATEIWPNGTEVNGQPVAGLDGDTGVVIQDYPEDRRLALDEIEWVRIEGYSGKDEMDYDGQAILYVYLPIKNGKVDKQEVSFDFYPDKNTDDYYDSVGYVDVVANGGNEMGKKSFDEGFMSNIGADGEHLYSIIYKFDDWDGSVQEYGKSEEDAIQNAIAKGKIDDEDEIVKIVDLGEKGEYLEQSRKLVKEGAGAGYEVGISSLEIGEVTEIKKLDDGDYSFTATITPGFYDISASDYYNDFFWQEHEQGDTPEAQIDGGVIHGTISPWEDTDDPEEWVRYQVEGSTFNLSFMYGGGWSHVNLPEDGQLYIDEHIEISPEPYFSIDDIQLDAIDLVQAVNAGYASIDDRYNDEDENGEPMDESYDPKGDDGRKRVMAALEEFRQVLWDDTKVDDEEEHDLRRSLYNDVDNAISQAIQKYFKYSRM